MVDPISLGIAGAALAGVLGSDRVRKILSNILSKPKSRSVVLELNGKTIVLDDVDPEEQKRIIEQFVKEHAKDAAAIPNEPNGSEEAQKEAPPATGGGEKR